MSVFVDTSAILAALNTADQHHQAAASVFRQLLQSDERLISTSYVLVETVALLQSRLGLEAVRTFHQDILPALEILWLTEEVHETAMAVLLAASRRRLSLVDCSSFVVMQRQGLRRAFAFDGHFDEHGFEPIPAPG